MVPYDHDKVLFFVSKRSPFHPKHSSAKYKLVAVNAFQSNIQRCFLSNSCSYQTYPYRKTFCGRQGSFQSMEAWSLPAKTRIILPLCIHSLWYFWQEAFQASYDIIFYLNNEGVFLVWKMKASFSKKDDVMWSHQNIMYSNWIISCVYVTHYIKAYARSRGCIRNWYWQRLFGLTSFHSSPIITDNVFVVDEGAFKV